MAANDPEALERLDYIFQHNYDRVEQTARRLGKTGGVFALNLSFKPERGLRSSTSCPDEDATMEFALAMAPFALPDSPYSAERWLNLLRAVAPGEHAQRFDGMAANLQHVKQGTLALTVNGRQISAEEGYATMATRIVFAGDIEAREFEERLAEQGVAREIIWLQYHGYCLDLWRFLQRLHAYRKQHAIRPTRVNRANACIYCKATSGTFTHVEHTIPESLGNQDSFLPRGYVCGKCKAALDRLEDGIQEMLPFSALVLTTRLGSKGGRLPFLRTQALHAKRKSPNKIIFRTGAGPRTPKVENLEGGGVKLNLTLSGRFDAHKVARILFKAALGAIALERGRDTVLEDRFDEARRYIITGGTFPNKMLVVRDSAPSNLMQVSWVDVDGVPVAEFILLGVRFGIVLGRLPVLDPDESLQPLVHVFNLAREKPETCVDSGERAE